jgi:hypothetical protein
MALFTLDTLSYEERDQLLRWLIYRLDTTRILDLKATLPKVYAQLTACRRPSADREAMLSKVVDLLSKNIPRAQIIDEIDREYLVGKER